ncbi:WhiB family transcriptional regulator [Streptomyces anulatus]|uniref:WhiB family transcriptional regulator n=1 Tax=Streptomyces anulatus TaxID=1892 RepID=UPI0036DA95D5
MTGATPSHFDRWQGRPCALCGQPTPMRSHAGEPVHKAAPKRGSRPTLSKPVSGGSPPTSRPDAVAATTTLDPHRAYHTSSRSSEEASHARLPYRRPAAADIHPADGRLPFPVSEQPLSCRTDPALFAIEDVSTDKDPRAREKALAQARRACSGCPVVTGCLKWALANPDLTKSGVWAAATKRDRNGLRKQLTARLGDDWAGVVADQDRRRREQRRTTRTAPPTVRDQALARLELELVPTRPEPYTPWKQPITPQQAASNRRVVELALTGKAA